MSKVRPFGDSGADPVPQQKSKTKPLQIAAKRVKSALLRKVEIKLGRHYVRSLTNRERGWICGDAVAIPGLDTSFRRNSARHGGLRGRVVVSQGLASQSQQRGGKANG